MMSGNRFVQGERFHLPFRPRMQVVGVHEITACPPSARGAWWVASARETHTLRRRSAAPKRQWIRGMPAHKSARRSRATSELQEQFRPNKAVSRAPSIAPFPPPEILREIY